MLKEIYHALPAFIWMAGFLLAMIFSFVPMYFLLMWLATTISKYIEKGKEAYAIKRRKRKVTRNNKNNS